ncbi:protein tramtrack, beta isoform isoform X3 [Pararge aegeria]|uniref:protein tramtrack, beta isoform isoform X3 n=1 Tax=Pararge aegeria TaxID=116150 RepID=UPI0019D2ED6E|nr:protein tramtrack, beta isoform isoform X3 [Pararge aegeria]
MASDEQFSLCWNNFHANMSAGFHGLLSRGDLVDVTLAAEGRLLQAHKLVLSVCSPYFQEMFKMNPTHHPIVFLKDVSHSALRDLLQFMYQGEVNVKQEELASFISTAEQLQVKGLTGNQNEESSTPSKPKPTSRPGPRSSQQRQSVMTKLETDLDSKPSSTPVAIKRPNRPSIASNNSSSSQSGPVKRKCVDPLEAGPSGSAKDEFVTIPDEDENNAVAPKMEPEFVNESMWDEDDDGTNNDETNFGEDDSNMEMSGFDGSTGGDGNITGGGEGGAVGDAQDSTSPDLLGSYSEHPPQSLQRVNQIVVTPDLPVPIETGAIKTDEKKTKFCRKRAIVRPETPKPLYSCGCHHNCVAKINGEIQNDLFNEFWSLSDRQTQRDYLVHRVKFEEPKKSLVNESRKKFSLTYTFVYRDNVYNVCRQFFMNTLNVSEKVIRYALLNKDKDLNLELPQEASFSTTSRGGTVIVYKGFRFRRHVVSDAKTRWHCAAHRNKGCRAYLYTIGTQIVRVNNNHNHDIPEDIILPATKSLS